MILKKLTITTALAAIQLSSHAATWVKWYDDSKTTYSYNAETVERVENRVRVETKSTWEWDAEQKRLFPDAKPITGWTRRIINCDDGSYVMTEIWTTEKDSNKKSMHLKPDKEVVPLEKGGAQAQELFFRMCK